jgi:hypothetical protein
VGQTAGRFDKRRKSNGAASTLNNDSNDSNERTMGRQKRENAVLVRKCALKTIGECESGRAADPAMK